MSSQECPATEKQSCKDCKKKKPLSSFYKTKRENGAVRYLAVCKPCFGTRSAASYQKRREANLKRAKQYREENEDGVKAYLREWYKKNRKKVIAKSRAYQALSERKQADKKRLASAYLENREEVRARQNARNATPEGKLKQKVRYLKHYAANKSYYAAKSLSGRVKRKTAKLPWVKYEDLKPWYEMAKELSQRTGTKHVVDHIVPLKHRDVCGLHVPWNLQVIPELENLRKHNRLMR
jgi:hypothetical protein